MALIWKSLVWLLSSKKRVALVAAMLLTLLQPLVIKLGLNLSMEQVLLVVGALATYIVGQGLADIGVEAKKLETKKK